MQTYSGIPNDALLLRHARPGSVGLLSAWSPEPSGSAAAAQTAGAWTHVFAVLDRVVRGGWEELHIVEATTLYRAHLIDPLARPDPTWDGPQRSVILARRLGDGRTRGQDERAPLRRYRDPIHTPNMALFELGLEGPSLRAFAGRAAAALEGSPGYARAEIAGATISGGGAQDAIPTLLQGGLGAVAFVRALFEGICPVFDGLPAGLRLDPEGLYHHLAPRVQGWQVLRVMRPAALRGGPALRLG